MVAHRIDHLANVLPHLSETWQFAGKRHGHCRPRPLEAVLHPEGRFARVMKRAPSARTSGARRDRERRLGAQDATLVAPRMSCGKPRARIRSDIVPRLDRAG